MKQEPAIKVLLADDHQMVLEGLKILLQDESGIEIIGTALDGEEVMEALRNQQVDVLVLDYQMPKMDGLATLQAMQTEFPHVRTIVVSFSNEGKVIHDVIKAGARGYVIKNRSYDDLVDAIRLVARGGKYTPEEVSEALMDFLQQPPTPDDPTAQIQIRDREEEVIACMMDGLPAKQIAHLLNMAIPTVNTHKANLYERFNLNNGNQLVLLGKRRGIIPWSERTKR